MLFKLRSFLRVGCCPLMMISGLQAATLEEVTALPAQSQEASTPLTPSDIEHWPEITNEAISNDGRYVLYAIRSGEPREQLVIRATNGSFMRTIEVALGTAAFTEDNRRVIFSSSKPALNILELSTGRIETIDNVESFDTPKEGNGEWLGYLLGAPDNAFVLRNLASGEVRKCLSGIDFLFSDNGSRLVIRSSIQVGPTKGEMLTWSDLTTGQEKAIWSGAKVINLAFDQSGERLAFLTEDGEGEKKTAAMWYFEPGMRSARLLVDASTPGMEAGLVLEGVRHHPPRFSANGRAIFFGLHRLPRKPDPTKVGVDVWSYRDETSQTEQQSKLRGESRAFRAVVNLQDGKVIRLDQDGDTFWGFLNPDIDVDYVWSRTNVDTREGYRRRSARPDFFLTSTKDGSRKCIIRELLADQMSFSPAGKFVYWYDPEQKNYFTYEIKSGEVRNVTSLIPVALYLEDRDVAALPIPFDPVVWMKNDESVLIYDRYDIWQVDPLGVKQPENITNGYGRANQLMLRMVYKKGRNYSDAPPIENHETLVLSGFNEASKENGFFSKEIGRRGDPERLIVSPNVYYFPTYHSPLGMQLSDFMLKAKHADVFLTKRMGVSEFPNLQVTVDFRTFRAMSDLAPQKRHEWYTADLVHWTTLKGRRADGILYRPNRLDPKKKYPIILSVYEKQSGGLNKFIRPSFATGKLNIPWFVTRGYFVFCPDIRYTVGNPGEGIYDYVLSAASMLAKMPGVDATKMGIQGHSWGGFEVNYLVTKTDQFAAAASGAGVANLVSMSGQEGAAACAGPAFTEQHQFRMGQSLWQIPQAYLEHSPVLSADAVKTPMLLMQNKGDQQTPWLQGVEWFTALRRLEKKVWMLQYDGADHIVEEANAADFSTRLTQFFDHYLKGAAAPRWMTEGIPAQMKQIDTGLELDASGKEP